MPKKTIHFSHRVNPVEKALFRKTNMPKKTIHDEEILYGMAKGPWADFWALREEKRGQHFGGMNIYDICPEPPAKAKAWARKIADQIVRMNEGLSLEALYLAARHDGFSEDREDFGFHLGCQASGMGIRWDDNLTPNVELEIKVPYNEFYI